MIGAAAQPAAIDRRPTILDTCQELLDGSIPNFLRLYLNPYVAQACHCLARYVTTSWPADPATAGYQTFLANSRDEAVSGAVKLARYSGSVNGGATAGVLIDPAREFSFFECLTVADEQLELIPELWRWPHDDGSLADWLPAHSAASYAVVAPGAVARLNEPDRRALVHWLSHGARLVIRCVDRTTLESIRSGGAERLDERRPDMVVFDESFVGRDVPFAAFTARRRLYDHWNRGGKATFHSTTFQPNAVSSLHFLRSLERDDPQFMAGIAKELAALRDHPRRCATAYRKLYSPALERLIRIAGFTRGPVRASGHFVFVGPTRYLDMVAGVACSMRGHNPPDYVAEMSESARETTDEECRVELTDRLRVLTGLALVLPAVSGATAVENALKLALAAQAPRRDILVLNGGYGGKTLFALTATASDSLKRRLGPLYPHVSYVDPFAPDAIRQIDAILSTRPMAAVQMELVQGVGGVRRIPEPVIRFLAAQRQRCGFHLIFDETQTGMYRTGPFVAAHSVGVTPDILVIGKGTSDMMFPAAFTLFGRHVGDRVDAAAPGLSNALHAKFFYKLGYRTLLHSIRRCEADEMSARVRDSGRLFAERLAAALGGCRVVRDIRVFGLLAGIELRTPGSPRGWRARLATQLYLLGLLNHRPYRVIAGFCQYEPHVLKLTPPLTIEREEIDAACEALAAVLHTPLPRLAAAAGMAWLRSRLGPFAPDGS